MKSCLQRNLTLFARYPAKHFQVGRDLRARRFPEFCVQVQNCGRLRRSVPTHAYISAAVAFELTKEVSQYLTAVRISAMEEA